MCCLEQYRPPSRSVATLSSPTNHALLRVNLYHLQWSEPVMMCELSDIDASRSATKETRSMVIVSSQVQSKRAFRVHQVLDLLIFDRWTTTFNVLGIDHRGIATFPLRWSFHVTN